MGPAAHEYCKFFNLRVFCMSVCKKIGKICEPWGNCCLMPAVGCLLSTICCYLLCKQCWIRLGRVEVAPEGGSFSSAYTGNQTSAKVESLEPATSYSFRVLGCNAKGEGPFSDVAETSTSLLPPFPPSQVSADSRRDAKNR